MKRHLLFVPTLASALAWTTGGCDAADPHGDPGEASTASDLDGTGDAPATTGEGSAESESTTGADAPGDDDSQSTDEGSSAASSGSTGDTGDAPMTPEDAPVEGVCLSRGDSSDAFVDCIEGFEPADGADFGHDALPDIVLGPPHGGGPTQGSTHVASLGCGGRITVFFDGPGIEDRPGPDFLVFENPFVQGDETFSEPAVVLVSEDGVQWSAFDCTTDEGWPPVGCAGIEPVLATADDPSAATDPEQAGGDAFDLAEVGLARARYVRLIDRTVEYHGSELWCGSAGGFDLDAIAVVESNQ